MVLEEMLLAERREGRSEGKSRRDSKLLGGESFCTGGTGAEDLGGNRSVRKRISVISYTRRREVFLVSGS